MNIHKQELDELKQQIIGFSKDYHKGQGGSIESMIHDMAQRFRKELKQEEENRTCKNCDGDYDTCGCG